MATPRRPRNLPAGRPNPIRDLITQKTKGVDSAREKRRVQELKNELPSIIQDRVGEQINKLENKLLSEVRELSQRTIEESTAAISEQLSGRIDTLEKVAKVQTETLEHLRDTSRIAEEKVSSAVEQIERSLSDMVPGGFVLEPSDLPPLPGSQNRGSPVVQIGGAIYLDGAPPKLRMPDTPENNRLTFRSIGLAPDGTHPQFHPEAEVVKAEPMDLSEVVGRYGFCPNCTSTDLRRANRKGLFEEFLRLFSIAPFRCRACRHKFYRF